MTTTSGVLPLVFVSYARQNLKLLKRWLLFHVLESASPKVEVWFDKRLTEGTEFSTVIRDKLHEAAVAVMFLSEAFFRSSYIQTVELPIIRARVAEGTLLALPVLLSPCSFEADEWFSGLHIFTYKDKPLIALRRFFDKEEARLELKRALERLLAPRDDRPPVRLAPRSKPKLRRPVYDRPYLRRRCRVVTPASPSLIEFLNNLLRDQLGFEEHPERLGHVKSLRDFERIIATAALHEAYGRVTQSLATLTSARFTGNEEGCRRLYRGIAYEKLWKKPAANMGRAISDYLWILSRPQVDPILTIAAQFNVNVCLEKREAYKDVDFEVFLDDRSLAMPTGEFLWHKALVMQMIVCMKTRNIFIHGDLVPLALSQQKEQDPGGYAKTLITWRRYTKEPPADAEIEDVTVAVRRLPVNGRAAILFELALDLLSFGRDDESAKLSKMVDELAAKSRDPTVERYRGELMAIKQSR